MAIFNTRIKVANNPKKHTSIKVVFASEIPIKDIEKSKKDTTNGFLLSNLETNQPELIVPNNAQKGITNNIVPNCASFKLKVSLIVGILEAQDEKQSPDRKKYELSEIRCKCLISIFGLNCKNNTYLN